ncbi:AraC-family transcriptional regulator [Streptomyces sp. SPB78]|nr:AraC-family transcriptional regulator [Streptomyces sp. SPB78]
MVVVCEDPAMVSRVAILVRDGVLPLELGLAHQLFGAARDAGGQCLYEVVTCAPRAGRVRTDADFPLHAPHGPSALADADTILVPASHETDESLRTPGRSRWEAALLTAAARGARIASICTGAFVLASLGLLDGRRATTHWKSAALLAASFPGVRVDERVLYIDEGAVLTSAGEAAGIDLCLHMIRADHGARVAADVARTTVVPPHREGGQAQYIPAPVTPTTGPATAASRAWALTRLAQPPTLADWAAHAHLSVRTFTRRFRAETGTTPGAWLLAARLDRARELLEHTPWTIATIATRTGFGTPANLRGHFRRNLGVSPQTYRATFGAAPHRD